MKDINIPCGKKYLLVINFFAMLALFFHDPQKSYLVPRVSHLPRNLPMLFFPSSSHPSSFSSFWRPWKRGCKEVPAKLFCAKIYSTGEIIQTKPIYRILLVPFIQKVSFIQRRNDAIKNKTSKYKSQQVSN